MVEVFAKRKVEVVAISVDPVVDPELDVLSPQFRRVLTRLVLSELVIGVFGGPPCSTWSAARNRPLPCGGGPRPLRDRAKPFECIEGRSQKEFRQVQIGSAIAISVIHFLGLASDYGAWIGLEHLENQSPPTPSLFITEPV